MIHVRTQLDMHINNVKDKVNVKQPKCLPCSLSTYTTRLPGNVAHGEMSRILELLLAITL